MILLLVLVSVAVALFAVFPLTDTDIWWHLACAREWVTTWTPVREPVVNVHEYFQQIVAFVYNIGGAPLLVSFKALLWGCVFALFLAPSVLHRHTDVAPSPLKIAACVALLFVFRYQFEIRPVLLSLIFLGIYWNVLPWLFYGWREERKMNHDVEYKSSRHGFRQAFHYMASTNKLLGALAILFIQWFWSKTQGLYVLGLVFAYGFFLYGLWYRRWVEFGKVRKWNGVRISLKSLVGQTFFVILLFAIPLLHQDGFNLIPYPVELLDRLLGLSPSAAVFASEIAENRSPITLLLDGENVVQSVLMLVLCVTGIIVAAVRWYSQPAPHLSWQLSWQASERIDAIFSRRIQPSWLFVTAVLALVAERNFVLFLPVFLAVFVDFSMPPSSSKKLVKEHHVEKLKKLSSRLRLKNRLAEKSRKLKSTLKPLVTFDLLLAAVVLAFIFGLWVKSLSAYDSMVAYQRVPVAAAEWMKSNPHSGRLFNDDRAGGYLAFVNPSDSTYIDGRFILKTADFFESYLSYAKMPRLFLADADSQNIDRVVLPLRYYARWGKLIATLDSAENWHVAYQDPFFVVIDRTEH